ncbi:MAG: YlbF family regulator [Bacilli bacterium]|nr:YlbF family regulator [Bacilli bacterium]
MDDIIKETLELKQIILSSNEYKEYKKSERVLNSNKEINDLIERIKKLQKEIINKEDKKEETDKEEIEVQSLYKKLNSYKEYRNYIDASKKFNESLTYIQKEFEDYFNQFII